MTDLLLWAGVALLVLVSLAIYAVLLLVRERRRRREFAHAREERMRAAVRNVRAHQTFEPQQAPPPEQDDAAEREDAA